MDVRAWSVVLGLAAALLAAPAYAAPEDGSEAIKAAARVLADKGYQLYEAGRYEEAIDHFRRAEQLFHAPTLIYARAKATAKAGRLLEARELFQSVVNEPVPVGAPPEFRGAIEAAAAEVKALDARIPTIAIVVKGAAGRAVQVLLDGTEVSPDRRDQPLARDPGAHAIVVMPSQGAGVTRKVTLNEGARERVEIELEPIASKAPALATTSLSAAMVTPPKVKEPEVRSPRRDTLVPALVSFGVSAVGFGVGIGAGVDTLGRASTIKQSCVGDICPERLREDAQTARTMGAISTAGFVVGGAGAVAGTVLLLVRPKVKAPSKVGLTFGLGAIGVEGVF